MSTCSDLPNMATKRVSQPWVQRPLAQLAMKMRFRIKMKKLTSVRGAVKKANAITMLNCSEFITRTISKAWQREQRMEIWSRGGKGHRRVASTQLWSLQGRKTSGQYQVTGDQRNLEINQPAASRRKLVRVCLSLSHRCIHSRLCVKQTPGKQHHSHQALFPRGKINPSMPLPQVS